MPTDHADANHIAQNGWRQGSVLTQSHVDFLVQNGCLQPSPGDQQFVVISHDCDVTNSCFDTEPYVELLHATVLPETKKDGNFTWGKSPRRYHLERKCLGKKSVWCFSVHDFKRIPRCHLASHSPEIPLELNIEETRSLALWRARRYTRSAFPNAFIDRTRTAISRLRKAFKTKGEYLTGIYINLSDDEFPEDKDYTIILFCSMRCEDYDDNELRCNTQELLDQIESILGTLDGIDVVESVLKSEGEITIDDLRCLRRWDFDDLTIRGQSLSDIPPEA